MAIGIMKMLKNLTRKNNYIHVIPKLRFLTYWQQNNNI